MATSEELLAKLERWLSEQPSPPTLFDVVNTRDVELMAAFILKRFRKGARTALVQRMVDHHERHGDKARQGALGRIADGIARAWNLSEHEELALLGLQDALDLEKLRMEPPEDASADVLERMSMLFDIYQALQTLLPKRRAANAWIKKANKAPLFAGSSALQVMTSRGLDGIRDVRAYLLSQAYSA